MKIDFDIVVSVFETIKIVNEKEKQKEQVKASSTQIKIDNINITTDIL